MPDTIGRIAATIGDAAEHEIVRAIADPTIPVRSEAPPVAGAAIAGQIEAAIRPIIAHATNGEPFWRSRVFWGAMLSLATPLLALAGVTLEPDEREAVVTTVLLVPPVAGALVALWGRFGATRPIGA